MRFCFVPMTLNAARNIIHWKYEDEYSVYNYDNEVDHILDTSGWGNTLFAVEDENTDLVGELSLGFLDQVLSRNNRVLFFLLMPVIYH